MSNKQAHVFFFLIPLVKCSIDGIKELFFM